MKRIISILFVAILSFAVVDVVAAPATNQTTTVKGKNAGKKSKGKKTKKAAAYESLSVYDPEVHVDRSPMFRGGDAGLFDFIRQNLRYPKKALEAAIQGSVLVRFAIDPDGKVRDVEVVQSVNQYLDAEAVRVVKSLPKFKPGMVDGKPVKFFYNLPVKFILE